VNYEAVNYVDYANYEADSGKTNMENVCLTKDISLVSNIIGLTGKAEGCRNGDQHRFVTCVAWEGLYVFLDIGTQYIGMLIVLQYMRMLLLYLAGSFGMVSVDWFIDSALTTAVPGVDYVADGATLTFQPREILKGMGFNYFVVCFLRVFMATVLQYFCTLVFLLPSFSSSYTSAGFRVHCVLEKSLKMIEFGIKTSRPLQVLENR